MSALAPELATSHAGGRPDGRGNVYDRAARKRWLLQAFGNGRWAPCRWCGCKLTARTLEVDRWPVCGHDGGNYRRKNIVPACRDCNAGRCTRKGAPCRVAPGQTLELFAWQPRRALVMEVARAE